MPIKINHVSFFYLKKTPNEVKALDDVTFEIKDHSITTLIGHTGSGKSTLIQLFNALELPSEGTIEVDDFLITPNKRKNKHIKELRRHIASIFQFPEYQLFEETVEKDVAFGVKNFGVKNEEALKRAHEALAKVGLDESYYSRAPFDLSGGEKRKVAIAGILAIDPDVLIFDEPTAGFDPQSSKDLMKLICDFHKQGKTIIVITHDMDLVNTYAQRVVLLEKGELAFDGTLAELFSFIQGYDRLDIPTVIKVAIALKEKGMDIDVNQIRKIDDLLDAIKRWRDKA